jgi:predicted RNase H-like nuclease (RuvC/YqgF family)
MHKNVSKSAVKYRQELCLGPVMKKLFALLIVCSFMMAASAVAQKTLADVAREYKAKKKPNPQAKVIDNDVIPSALVSSSDTASATVGATEQKDAVKKDDDKDQEKKSLESDKKVIDEWKSKIADQKKEITQLERELDVAEREARLHAAAYYADAGTMLRDQTKFAEDSRKEQSEIDTKKQALADAKQKLDDLQEQARKSGVPANQLD